VRKRTTGGDLNGSRTSKRQGASGRIWQRLRRSRTTKKLLDEGMKRGRTEKQTDPAEAPVGKSIKEEHRKKVRPRGAPRNKQEITRTETPRGPISKKSVKRRRVLRHLLRGGLPSAAQRAEQTLGPPLTGLREEDNGKGG